MEVEENDDWTHYIKLNFPNGSVFYWYRITFTSPDESLQLPVEEVLKQFEKMRNPNKPRVLILTCP